MEIKTLIVGLLFSVGIFSVKTGIGLNYFLGTHQKRWLKVSLTLLFLSIYFVLFYLSYRILSQINILAHYDMITGFMASGMTLHFLMAALMIFWGIGLLKNTHPQKVVNSWLILVLPCPVCMTVIFFLVAFCLAVYPDAGFKAVLGTYAGFLLITIITGFSVNLFSGSEEKAEAVLGTSMLAISVYFMLSVFIMPVFSDAVRIYSIAGYKGETETNAIQTVLMMLILVILITTGWWLKHKRMSEWRG